ncbi:MAG: hypothetical protein LQ351_005729 [Letrouitia transgressa]|nr:MAG: hypothetical protein LQ351_005729 [Letrouitia transgressa]
MPSHESHSPARRPQLFERTSSTQSLSRASPSPGKGSLHKMHKAHAVGHGRHPHGRIPSYGRNLNKLSKLTPVQPVDDSKATRNGKSQEISTSPLTSNIKRNASNVSLPRTGSKVSVKRNSSNLSQKRNKSSSKLGNPKAGKITVEREGRSKKSSKATPTFSVGSDDQDESWTETNSSPSAHRPNSMTGKQISLVEPPTPDEPPVRSPTNLPDSPPQSPPMGHGEFAQQRPQAEQSSSTPFSQPPDAEVVTNRLLSRHRHPNAKTQMSSVSATITPSGSNGSPSFRFSNDATPQNDQNILSDGSSQPLQSMGSPPGKAAPASVSQLQSALANIHQQRNRRRENRSSPNSPPSANHLHAAQRARSAAYLSAPTNADILSRSLSPPVNSSIPKATTLGRASPFAASRNHQSLTQLKLDLQRLSSKQEEAQVSTVEPSGGYTHGAFNDFGSDGGEQDAGERASLLWKQAQAEYMNVREHANMVGDSLKREEKRAQARGKRELENSQKVGLGRDEAFTQETSEGNGRESREQGRGRIRFELGAAEDDADREGYEDSRRRIEGILQRMWDAEGLLTGED